MVSKNKKHKFVSYFIIIFVVFLAGVIFGKTLSDNSLNEIDNQLRNSELNTESYMLEKVLIESLDNDNCDYVGERLKTMVYELGLIGRKLITETKDLSPTTFNILKRKYHLMQIQSYLMYQKNIDKCQSPNDIILFYYGDDDSSKQQGLILDDLVIENNVQVFAIEYNYSKDINFLEEYYGVTNTPHLIVNFDNSLPGLSNKEDLLEILK